MSRKADMPVRIIDDIELLRLVTQPVRLRLFETLRTSPEPLGAKTLATMLGTTQTKLYYHIKLLEEAGLIQVASTRVVSGITEKLYTATVARIGVDRSLLDSKGVNSGQLEMLLAVLLDEVRGEIRRSAQAGLIDLTALAKDEFAPHRLVLGRIWFRLTDQQLAALSAEIDTLLERYDALSSAPADDNEPGGQARRYEMLLGFYPVAGDDRDPETGQ